MREHRVGKLLKTHSSGTCSELGHTGPTRHITHNQHAALAIIKLNTCGGTDLPPLRVTTYSLCSGSQNFRFCARSSSAHNAHVFIEQNCPCYELPRAKSVVAPHNQSVRPDPHLPTLRAHRRPVFCLSYYAFNLFCSIMHVCSSGGEGMVWSCAVEVLMVIYFSQFVDQIQCACRNAQPVLCSHERR